MFLEIHEKIDAIVRYSLSDKGRASILPIKIRWRGREHVITKLGYLHKYREGRETVHIFEVSNTTTAFRLKHNSETLTWELEAISDGNA